MNFNKFIEISKKIIGVGLITVFFGGNAQAQQVENKSGKILNIVEVGENVQKYNADKSFLNNIDLDGSSYKTEFVKNIKVKLLNARKNNEEAEIKNFKDGDIMLVRNFDDNSLSAENTCNVSLYLDYDGVPDNFSSQVLNSLKENWIVSSYNIDEVDKKYLQNLSLYQAISECHFQGLDKNNKQLFVNLNFTQQQSDVVNKFLKLGGDATTFYEIYKNNYSDAFAVISFLKENNYSHDSIDFIKNLYEAKVKNQEKIAARFSEDKFKKISETINNMAEDFSIGFDATPILRFTANSLEIVLKNIEFIKDNDNDISNLAINIASSGVFDLLNETLSVDFVNSMKSEIYKKHVLELVKLVNNEIDMNKASPLLLDFIKENKIKLNQYIVLENKHELQKNGFALQIWDKDSAKILNSINDEEMGDKSWEMRKNNLSYKLMDYLYQKIKADDKILNDILYNNARNNYVLKFLSKRGNKNIISNTEKPKIS